jgi:polysaccharide biosynthesis PFTS motif protein
MERGLQIQTLNCFDAHLVWNSYQADFLESLGVHGVFVVGSIIFQPRIEIDLENSFFSILFTDVTPTSDESYFYNSHMSISTLQTIVDVLDEIKVESGLDIKLYLKPKRSYSAFHSKEYVYLVKCLNKSKKVILLDPNSNLYKAVSQSNFLLSTPYTSTNFIASDLNIPSAYFCQNFDPWILEDTHHGFEVIISRTRLKNLLLTTLNKI